jgi:hypothetical protein
MREMGNIQLVEEPTTGNQAFIPEVYLTCQDHNMVAPHDVEERQSRYSNHFPRDLPARPPLKTPWSQCIRGFWTFSLSSYSIIHTPTGAAQIRHLAMVTILLLRTAMSGLSILSAVMKANIASIVLYSLLAVLGLWFTATCLAVIDDAEGDKQVKGVIVVGYR